VAVRRDGFVRCNSTFVNRHGVLVGNVTRVVFASDESIIRFRQDVPQQDLQSAVQGNFLVTLVGAKIAIFKAQHRFDSVENMFSSLKHQLCSKFSCHGVSPDDDKPVVVSIRSAEFCLKMDLKKQLHIPSMKIGSSLLLYNHTLSCEGNSAGAFWNHTQLNELLAQDLNILEGLEKIRELEETRELYKKVAEQQPLIKIKNDMLGSSLVNNSFEGSLPGIIFRVDQFNETDDAGLAFLENSKDHDETMSPFLKTLKRQTNVQSIVDLNPRQV
jgi:hypothetical protein